MAPCLCGHGMHFGVECPECQCPHASPDYVAAAEESGELERLSPEARSSRVAELRAAARDLAVQLRYAGPPRRGVRKRAVRIPCAYCGERFGSTRIHAETCSGACRQALSVARRYECEADVPPASTRRDTFSAERQRATGSGLMTASECYAADVRVVLARCVA